MGSRNMANWMAIVLKSASKMYDDESNAQIEIFRTAEAVFVLRVIPALVVRNSLLRRSKIPQKLARQKGAHFSWEYFLTV